jgi:hypothetical protein
VDEEVGGVKQIGDVVARAGEADAVGDSESGGLRLECAAIGTLSDEDEMGRGNPIGSSRHPRQRVDRDVLPLAAAERPDREQERCDIGDRELGADRGPGAARSTSCSRFAANGLRMMRSVSCTWTSVLPRSQAWLMPKIRTTSSRVLDTLQTLA